VQVDFDEITGDPQYTAGVTLDAFGMGNQFIIYCDNELFMVGFIPRSARIMPPNTQDGEFIIDGQTVSGTWPLVASRGYGPEGNAAIEMSRSIANARRVVVNFDEPHSVPLINADRAINFLINYCVSEE